MIKQTPLPLGDAAFFVFDRVYRQVPAMLIFFGHDLPPDSLALSVIPLNHPPFIPDHH
jgi:hypothetical protein